MIDHDNLEEFADPVAYDRQDNSDTGVAFYAALARETGGPMREIACGTGRVAIPIAREGFAVTGLRELAFFSTVTTFGTPSDVTVSELAIESFFPADPETAAALRESL